MLRITVPPSEIWDEEKEEFVVIGKEQKLQLEHSLVSISKWESKWCKSFFTTRDKTNEEILDYIKHMTLTQNVPSYVYQNLTFENISEIKAYIEAPMTATVFMHNEERSRDTITTELIYYWMISLNIPFECQKWHINRLLTLIRVCSLKNTPPKKMSDREIMRRNRELNELRKKKWNTKG